MQLLLNHYPAMEMTVKSLVWNLAVRVRSLPGEYHGASSHSGKMGCDPLGYTLVDSGRISNLMLPLVVNGLLPKHVLPSRQSIHGWKAAPTGRDAKVTSVGEAFSLDLHHRIHIQPSRL